MQEALNSCVLTWPRPLTLIGYCIPFKVFKTKCRSLKVVQGRLGESSFVFLTVQEALNSCILTWPRPLTLIGYCIPFKVFKTKCRSLKVVQGRLGGSSFVFLPVAINCTSSTKCMMQLAPPLDSDWLLHSLVGHLINLAFLFVSWCNMATLSHWISLDAILSLNCSFYYTSCCVQKLYMKD